MRHGNLPPILQPETRIPEWLQDGVSRTVVTYGDRTHNVGYEHTPGGAAVNTVNLRREYRGTFGTDATSADPTPPYRLIGKIFDPKKREIVERHYYVDPTRGVMLIDKDPKGGTKPLVPVRLRTLPSQVTLGQPLELPEDAQSLVSSTQAGPRKTMPITSAMVLADGYASDTLEVSHNRWLEQQLPTAAVSRSDLSGCTNPIIDMLPRFVEAEAELNKAGIV